jgi:HSP20 family protein
MAVIRWDPHRLAPRWFWRWPSLWEEDWPEFPEISEGLTVYETDNDLVVKANVAGVPADKVDVSVEGREVTIDAKHEEAEEEKKKKKVVYREARKAVYHYHFTSPCPIVTDPKKIEASVTDGVLTLSVPKAKVAKAKKVKVKVKK